MVKMHRNIIPFISLYLLYIFITFLNNIYTTIHMVSLNEAVLRRQKRQVEHQNSSAKTHSFSYL